MTCAVLAVPDVSRVGGGAQAPRAAVPIPDTLTFPRCVCGASPSVPAPAWRPLRAPACVTAAEVWSVLFISGSPAWRPYRHGARVTAAEVWSIPFSPGPGHGPPFGHPACVTTAEVWSGAQARRAAVPIPDTLTFPQRVSAERPLQSGVPSMAPPPPWHVLQPRKCGLSVFCRWEVLARQPAGADF